MNKELIGKKWTGTFMVPLGISLSLFTLYVTFQVYAGTTGLKIASTILFIASVLWCIWYLTAKTIKKQEASTSRIMLIANRRRRRLAMLIPVFAAVICFGAFLNTEEIVFSAMHGERSIVVFDSDPPGAKVRYAWILYADGDLWLEDSSEAREIVQLPKPTQTKAKVLHGQYWAVFELGDKRVQKKFIVKGTTQVNVEF